MKKPSKAQALVLQRLADGWALGIAGGLNSRVWMQKDGLGRGGETANVSVATFTVLRERGLITKIRDGFPSSEYGLTTAQTGQKL